MYIALKKRILQSFLYKTWIRVSQFPNALFTSDLKAFMYVFVCIHSNMAGKENMENN